nr:hypothetical protein [Tanacetum cinerariifolium]
MDTIINQQVAMDEALVPHAQILRIERSNFRLLSDIKSKESTLQLAYDVMRLDMLHICLRVHGQSFAEPPFKEEILAFIRFLRHSAAIRTLTNVNINKLYQPWRSFATIINKCLTEKSSGYNSLRLSQVEHKNSKKSNEMYYPRFTKVIIHHFMSKDPSIPRRNKVNWNYVRDDHMFSTIKLVSRHQNMQQFGALLPIELTNEEIKNFDAYKEYYATHISQASGSGADEGIGSIPGVLDVPTDESEEELSWDSTDEEGDDEGKDGDGNEEDDGDDGKEEDGDDDEDDDGEEGDDDDDDDDQEVVRDDDKDDEEEGGDDEQDMMKKNMMKKQGMSKVLILS